MTDGLVVLYDFEEAGGATVFDVSGVGTPLNLAIADLSKTTRIPGALRIDDSTIVKSAGAATKIIDAAKATNEITIEAWINPANTSQAGPARIVTLSKDTSFRNFTLGQSSNFYNTRLRSTSTSLNGMPSLSTPSGSLTAGLTHVVFTRIHPSGTTKTYINGVEVSSGSTPSSFSNWDTTFKFALANELTLNRTWLGDFHLVAIYNKALSSTEVEKNFAAGPECQSCAPDTRVANGLIALYDFEETSGDTVFDTSGFGTPLNLTIEDVSKTSRISGALSIDDSTIVKSSGPATKVIDRLKTTNEITIEAWVKPDSVSQSGPARIFTLSKDASLRNFTLGQDGDKYDTRLRTTTIGLNGTPSLSTPGGSLKEEMQHVVFTREHPSGDTKMYINGVLVSSSNAPSSFANWDTAFKLAFANELETDRTWLGELHLGAIYDRPLSASEMEQNFDAGPGSFCNPCLFGLWVRKDLIALYDFEEQSGATVFDVSGVGTPLDLTIADLAKTTRIPGALRIDDSTIIESAGAATKIIDAAKATNEITIEAWISPANTTQSGPARIVTLSKDSSERNFTLGQSSDFYNTRLRSTSTSLNGIPSLSTPSGSAKEELQHVVFTRSHPSGITKTYINGVEVASGSTSGSFSNWDTSLKFALANEFIDDRTWLGEFHLVAIYKKALTASQVEMNFAAGPECLACTPNTRVAGGLVVLYEFEEESGDTVFDTSGFGTPLNLTIEDVSKTSRIFGALRIDDSTIVKSSGPATKVIDRLKTTNEITIEAWVKPANTTQRLPSLSPARIFTLSKDTGLRNFTLGQIGDKYDSRLRTTSTSPNGTPSLSTPPGSLKVELQHVVFTREHPSGDTKMYINGVLVSSSNAPSSFATWDTAFKLAFANELTNNRAWLGQLHLAAIYDRPLSATEVKQNFDTGPGPFCPCPTVPRVTDDLVVLYDFEEASGDTVFDVSGVGTPLNLTIADVSKTTRIPGALRIDDSTIVESAGVASKIIDAAKSTNEITIEAWVRAANITQSGPARIVTLSKDASERNLTLGQSGDFYNTRLRSTDTTDNGIPSLSTLSGTVTTDLTHVVFIRSHPSGTTKMYINGMEVASGSTTGSFSNWDTSLKFALANEFIDDRTWLGDFHLVAIYKRALTAAEVSQNFTSGPECPTSCTPDNRVASGVIALYDFEETSGDTVFDTSGFGAPLNLTIEDVSKTSRIPGALRIDDFTIVKSAGPATKVIDRLKTTNEITIEAWVKPDSVSQTGPAHFHLVEGRVPP